jgi:4-amino-4-deoxy-L-arabinose transferase-like glycosyltransferase
MTPTDNIKPPTRDTGNAKVPIGGKKPGKPGKSSFWYWAAMVLIIIGAAAIRGRLLAIPLERDEGEYAYIAQMMLKGVPPYLSAYGMKLPGIYAVYALILAVFGQTQTAIHLGLLMVNAAAILAVFLLTRRLFDSLAAVIAAAVYTVMSLATPVLGLSANAEHFVILPVLMGVILLTMPVERRSLPVIFVAALLFGMAFIIKQHGIFFAIFAALYLLYSDLRCSPIQWKKLIITQFVFAAAAAVPFALTCLILWQAGAFDKFWFWTFTYAGKYTTSITLRKAVENFLLQFRPVVNFAIPIWFFSLLGLLRVLLSGRLRKHLPFIFGLLIFSFLCVCPAFYFRPHYFILLLPAVAVTAGAGFSGFCDWAAGYKSGLRRNLIAILAGLVVVGYSLFDQRTYLFDGNPIEVCRRIYWPNPFPESLQIAEFIRANSGADDTIAVIGSEPQIYFYSGRCAATHYIYTYPLMEVHDYAAEMQDEMIQEIESAKPQFLVLVNVRYSWLPQEGSITTIFNWAESYIHNFYNIVGMIEIYPDRQSIYHWNQQAVGYTPVSDCWVAVYKRKQ